MYVESGHYMKLVGEYALLLGAFRKFLGATLVNPNPNHSAEGEVETTPYENVLRLTGRHFPMKIPLQLSQN